MKTCGDHSPTSNSSSLFVTVLYVSTISFILFIIVIKLGYCIVESCQIKKSVHWAILSRTLLRYNITKKQHVDSPIHLFLIDKTFRQHWYKRFDTPDKQFTWFNKLMTFESLLMDNLQAMKLVFKENDKWRESMRGDLKDIEHDYDEDNIVSAETDGKRVDQINKDLQNIVTPTPNTSSTTDKPETKRPAETPPTDDTAKRQKQLASASFNNNRFKPTNKCLIFTYTNADDAENCIDIINMIYPSCSSFNFKMEFICTHHRDCLYSIIKQDSYVCVFYFYF